MIEKRLIWGKVEMVVCFNSDESDRECALLKAEKEINASTIVMMDGNLHLADGREMPVLVRKVNVSWFDSCMDYEL